MNLLQSIAFLGVLLIAISLVIDGVQRTMMKGGKRVAGVLQLAAILIGIIGFFIMDTHPIKNIAMGSILLIFALILYLISLIVRSVIKFN